MKIIVSGERGIWGKSLVLINQHNDFRICSTVITIEENIDHMAEARFHSNVAGSIYFRWLAAKETDHHDTLIYSNLFHVRNLTSNERKKTDTSHGWKIFVTDIFDTDIDQLESNCNVLQLIFDPQNVGNGKSIGDVDGRLGKVKIATDPIRKSVRELFHDDDLMLLPSDLTGPHRHLFVVLYDSLHEGNFLACAKIRHIRPKIVKYVLNLNNCIHMYNFSGFM